MDDNLVDMDIDMDDDTFLIIAKRAHVLDITFNEMLNICLKEAFAEADEYIAEHGVEEYGKMMRKRLADFQN